MSRRRRDGLRQPDDDRRAADGCAACWWSARSPPRCLLLFGAGLLLRTLIAVESFDRGYRAESVLTMLVDPLGSSYPTPEKLQQFYDQVEAEVRTVPGVQDVAWSSALPLGDSLYGDFALTYEVVGDPQVPEAQRPATNYQVVSPAYFSTRRPADRRRPRLRQPRHPRQPARSASSTKPSSATLAGRQPIGMKVAFKIAGSPQGKPTSARSSAWRSRSRAGPTSRRTSSRSTCRLRTTWSTTSS